MSQQPTRVLLVTYVYPPDNYAGAPRPFRLAKYLARLGFSVRVIAAAPAGECGEAGNLYRLRGEMDHKPLRSFWFWVERAIRTAILPHDEGITWVPRVLRLIRGWERNGLFASSPPVIFSTAPPLTVHLAGWKLKRRYGWKWIADFRDPLGGNPCRERRTRKIDAFLERKFFRDADAVIANTEAVAVAWRERYPEYRSKIHVLWNGFDPETAVRALSIRAGDQRVFSHVGSLYGGRYPHLLIRLLGRLIDDGKVDPDSILVRLAGPGSTPEGEDGARPWLDFQPRHFPREEAQTMAAQSHGLVLIDFNTAELNDHPGFQVPAKLFEYIGIGRPILACTRRGSPAEGILERAGIPYRCLYREASEEENSRNLREFLELSSEPTPASEWFEQQFNAAHQAGQLESIIRTLAAS